VDWTITTDSTRKDNDFTISGTLNVTVSGGTFDALQIGTVGGDDNDTCAFTGACAGYNAGTLTATNSANCEYTCTIPEGITAGGTRTVEVAVLDNGVSKATDQAVVEFQQGTVIDECVKVLDTDLGGLWTAESVCANATSKTYTASQPKECECANTTVSNTVRVVREDDPEITLATDDATVPIPGDCGCALQVDLTGNGTYNAAWNW